MGGGLNDGKVEEEVGGGAVLLGCYLPMKFVFPCRKRRNHAKFFWVGLETTVSQRQRQNNADDLLHICWGGNISPPSFMLSSSKNW